MISSEEISRRSQILISVSLGGHETLARPTPRIILMASGVSLDQIDASLSSLRIDWIIKPSS